MEMKKYIVDRRYNPVRKIKKYQGSVTVIFPGGGFADGGEEDSGGLIREIELAFDLRKVDLPGEGCAVIPWPGDKVGVSPGDEVTFKNSTFELTLVVSFEDENKELFGEDSFTLEPQYSKTCYVQPGLVLGEDYEFNVTKVGDGGRPVFVIVDPPVDE